MPNPSPSAALPAGFEYLGAAGNRRGIIGMVAASALFVIGDSLVKIAGHDLPLSEVIALRCAVSAVVLLAVMYRSEMLGQIGKALSHPFVRVRGGCEAFSTLSFFTGVLQMSYADATAILQATPLVVTAGAALFFGDPVGWRRWLAAVAGLIGVMLVLRPGTGAFNPYALWVILCVVLMAGRDLATRKIGTFVPTIAVTFVTILSIGVASLVLALFQPAWSLPRGGMGLAIVGAALASTLGFFTLVMATRSGEVAAVAPFRYSTVPFAVVASIIVFGDWPDGQTILGIVVLIGAGLYALHRERLRARDEARARAASQAA